MAKTRQKKVLVNDITREDAETAFAEYATADARAQQMTAKMDVEITRIREKYAAELQTLGEKRDEAFEKLQVFAENNRDEFGKKKSLEFAHGVIGFRTGTPKLKTLRGFTWDAATKLIKAFLPDYIRSKEEPAKDALLANREQLGGELAKVGLFVDQDEAFFVEPKKEDALAVA